MKMIRSAGLSLLVAAWLAACGGGEGPIPGSGSPAGAPTTKGTFTSVVSFGDSLSDVGAYAPATSLTGTGAAPYFGGKFTTNSATATVWVENLAGSMGLMVTPAEVGFAGQSVKCPAAAINAALAGTCTGYGQGGARVSDPNGIGRSGGALTVPVTTQVANHLSRFTSFKSSDLILVWAGHNDIFTQFGTFAAKATQIQTDAATGKITADAANLALFNAQTEAQAGMKQAAQDLAALVKTQILAKGGKYVAVMELLDIAKSPFGATVPASARPVLTDLSRIFNLWLRDGLTDQPVQLMDTNNFLTEVMANPTKFGFANVNVPACDAAKISVITGGRITDGSSLFCNSTAGVPYFGLRTGADVNTWMFADGVHPTTGGHKQLATYVAAQLKAYGWL